MKINPYLQFNGNCEEAFSFYAALLGGAIEMMMKYSDAPPDMPCSDEMRDKVMHVSIRIGETILMGSDAPPHYAETPAGFSVSLVLEDPAEARRIFQGLAESGQVSMEIQKTFWAELFGMVKDKFGVPWMINCEAAAPA